MFGARGGRLDRDARRPGCNATSPLYREGGEEALAPTQTRPGSTASQIARRSRWKTRSWRCESSCSMKAGTPARRTIHYHLSGSGSNAAGRRPRSIASCNVAGSSPRNPKSVRATRPGSVSSRPAQRDLAERYDSLAARERRARGDHQLRRRLLTSGALLSRGVKVAKAADVVRSLLCHRCSLRASGLHISVITGPSTPRSYS